MSKILVGGDSRERKRSHLNITHRHTHNVSCIITTLSHILTTLPYIFRDHKERKWATGIYARAPEPQTGPPIPTSGHRRFSYLRPHKGCILIKKIYGNTFRILHLGEYFYTLIIVVHFYSKVDVWVHWEVNLAYLPNIFQFWFRPLVLMFLKRFMERQYAN